MGDQKADKTLKPQISGKLQIPALIHPFVACRLRDWIKYNLYIYTYKDIQLSQGGKQTIPTLWIGIGMHNQIVERWSCLDFPLRQPKFFFHHLLSGL